MSDYEVSYDFVPINDKQALFVESDAAEILYSGAVGAGKSRAVCVKLYLIGLMYPGARLLLVRKEFTTLAASTLKTLLEDVIPPHMVVQHDKSRHFIVHKTGSFDSKGNELLSEIWYFGLDKGASQEYNTKILSTQWLAIGVDEITEITKSDYDVLKTRLRYKLPYLSDEENDIIPRQIFGATNPDSPAHWLHTLFPINEAYANGMVFRDEKTDRLIVLTTAYENAKLPKNYIKGLEESMVGITRERLLFGKWVQAQGIIYDKFNPATMVIDDKDLLPMEEYREFIAGADSNFPSPRSCVIIGLRADGGRDIIDEFYVTAAPVEMLKVWLEKCQGHLRGKKLTVYHDPSASEVIDRLNSGSIRCVKALNSVNEGIDSVNYYIENNKLRVHKRCTGWLTEISNYAWKKDDNKIEKQPDKTKPDHLMDATRYALHTHRRGTYKPVFA